MELIVTHLNADFDGFSSMLAARKLYPSALPVFPGSQEKRLREFIEAACPFTPARLKDIDLDKVTRLIVVDTKSPERLGELSVLVDRPGVAVHIYDHHRHEGSDLKGTVEVIEPVGSTATIFTELLEKHGIRPEPIEATALCLGIYEETGKFLFPTTTERDMKAAALLIKWGASLKLVSTFLKDTLEPGEVDILSSLAHSARERLIGQVKVVTSSAVCPHYLGDAAHLANRLLDMLHADAALVMLEMDGKVVIVGRSRTPVLNVAEVARQFGGDGHPTAASATVHEKPLELLAEELDAAIDASARPGKFASDVMTTPAITIDKSKTVKEAEILLTRYEVNVLPVADGAKYIGLISREAVEKARLHGFGARSVLDFADTEAASATKYTPVAEIETAMVERNQRFMPVIEDDTVIGVITRTDILRSMYDDSIHRAGLDAPVDGGRGELVKDITAVIRRVMPADVVKLLAEAGRIAESGGVAVYLVGGSVRDMLRNEENLDIDLVVEGDGMAFAREFAARLGGRSHPHERFRTAKVITDGFVIDVASARTEYYESPGALPTVLMSSIKKDLYRRDFTVNTLAVRLDGKHFGRLVDFFGGQRDIKDRTIRVLHNLSFVDDPTRAFRAVRFSERFGFRVSRHTEHLIRAAISMRLLDRLTGTRIMEELRLICSEREPSRALARLDGYGLLRAIHPDIKLTRETEGMLVAVDETLLWFGLLFTDEKPDRASMYLAAMMMDMDPQARSAAMSRLNIPVRLRHFISGARAMSAEAGRRMRGADPVELHAALSPLTIEAALFTMAMAEGEEAKKAVSHYLLELRKIRPELTGRDLKAMGIEPGPEYRAILDALLHARLRGRAATRDNEADIVRRMVSGRE